MRFFTVIIFLMICAEASARDVTGKISELVSYYDGHTIIRIENGPASGCPDAYRYSIGVKGQDAKAENMLSIALAAYIAGKSVHLSTSDGVCQGGQEKVFFIHL